MNRLAMKSRTIGLAAIVASATVAVPVGLTTVASPADATATRASQSHKQAQRQAQRQAHRHTHGKSHRRVAHRLLQAADLGPDWSAVDVDKLVADKKGQVLAFLQSANISPASCVSGLAIPPGYQSEAHRVFGNGASKYGPYLGEVVARFGNADQAQAAVEWAKNKINECKDLTVATGYGSVTISIRPAGARAVSPSATGYRVDGNLGGFVSAGGQVFIARKGRKIVIVGQGAVGQSSSSRLAATRKAAATAFDLL